MSPAMIRTCALRSGWPVSAANTWPRSVAVPGGAAVCVGDCGGRSCCGGEIWAACADVVAIDSVMRPGSHEHPRSRSSEDGCGRYAKIDGFLLTIGDRELHGAFARLRQEVRVGPR